MISINLKRVTILGGVLLVGAVALTAWALRPSPSYALLDSRFGASAWQPTKLLEVLAWPSPENGGNPLDLSDNEFYDIKHQALLRLLDLQPRQFHRRVPPRATQATEIDHPFALLEQRTATQIVILGTGTLKPCHREDLGWHGIEDYWEMERFTFSSGGELLSREAYHEEPSRTASRPASPANDVP